MKNKNIYLLFIILILVALITRLIAFYTYGDTELVAEWKILVHNLKLKGVLGFYVITGENIVQPKLASISETVLPSVFMPPLYAIYLFLINGIFSGGYNYLNIVIFSQIFFNLLTIFIFFKIIYLNENFKTSLIFTAIFSIIPIYIYSSVQISSISLQIFLIVSFFYFLKKYSLKKQISLFDLTLFSLSSGLLILLRGEFMLFYFLSIFYFFIFYSRNSKFFLITILMTLLVISPYLIRNYINFNSFVITKSFGYNLLKGNNPEFKVEGNLFYIEDLFSKKDIVIEADHSYEIKLDNFYRDKAIEYISNNYLLTLKNYFRKVFAFTFFDTSSSYKNYYNPFHIIPKLILSIFTLLGGLIVLKKKGFLQFLSIYYFSNILFFSIFFILPRYSLILLPIQILLSLEFIKFFLRKFLN